MIVAPDWLACTSQWLRAQPELDLLDGRVYTELPNNKTFPLLVVAQVADPPITQGPHWAFRVMLQVDVWGGPKALTWTVAETARVLMARRFTGAHDLEAGSFVVGGVEVGGIRRTTDQAVSAGNESGGETNRARPRASFDAVAVMHPAAGSSS